MKVISLLVRIIEIKKISIINVALHQSRIIRHNKKRDWNQSLLYFISVFQSFEKCYLIGIFQRTANRQSEC